MKPYYWNVRDGLTIYCGDSREVLPQLSQRIDAVVTDPPYGIALANHGVCDGTRSKGSYTVTGDSDQAVGQDIVSVCLHSWPVIAFASPRKPWLGNWQQYLVWHKGGAVGGGGDVAQYWKQSWELIQVARLGILNGSRDENVLRFNVRGQSFNLHPTQKPLDLIEYLIRKTSFTTILDPFMGSGTTLLAARNLGRDAIGIEIEERYCEIAVKRLEKAAQEGVA